jgi:N utilization substance protein B
MSTMTSRRAGRAFALQLLYACDGDPESDLSASAGAWNSEFELEVNAEAEVFARSLVAAASEHATAIDELVASSSKNWRLDRMSRVDRNILRLGACELIAFADVPVKVVINEAVELAKRFGTAESPAFVNGVLDRMAAASGRSPES